MVQISKENDNDQPMIIKPIAHTDGGDDSGDSFKLDSDDSFFSIPDYVPSELPDLAALGSGKYITRQYPNCDLGSHIFTHINHSIHHSSIHRTGLESKRELMSEFVEGEFDPNDQKMYKLLGLDTLDEKKIKVNPDDFTLPGVSSS